jgi:hypothetical protein
MVMKDNGEVLNIGAELQRFLPRLENFHCAVFFLGPNLLFDVDSVGSEAI